MVWITAAKYLEGYKVELEFSTKEKGVVDLEQFLDEGVFQALKQLDYFVSFTLNSWTIEWDNGADFAPEFLYNQAKK